MELYLAIRGSEMKVARLFPLIPGRTLVAGRYPQSGGPLVDGRYPSTPGLDADKNECISLEIDLTISRYHFGVGWDEVGPWVRDWKSRNGTFLNEIRLKPY